MMYDITFCNRECNNKECERNLKYINIPKNILISVANFTVCKDFKESEDK